MIDEEQELSMEDRLKGIVYQFVNLYERWSEDRQIAAKQGADMAKLVNLFTDQVKAFQSLEPSVKRSLSACIEQATRKSIESIGGEVRKEANLAIGEVASELRSVSHKAGSTLSTYEKELIFYHWKVIGISVFTTVLTCLLLVWLLIPKPVLPLTDRQIGDLRSGEVMKLVWSKLSKKEQQHWKELANEVLS